MGCCNSPGTFNHLMAMVISGLKCCLAFTDDTIVFSSSFEQHMKDVQLLFGRFCLPKLKLKRIKCCLFQTECEFLGYWVSAEGIEVQKMKAACIQVWAFPKNIHELLAFLGLCSYYWTYVKNFAAIAVPLMQCLQKGVALENTEKRVKAFEKLKVALMDAQILGVPHDDPLCKWVVDSDVSSHVAGAVL